MRNRFSIERLAVNQASRPRREFDPLYVYGGVAAPDQAGNFAITAPDIENIRIGGYPFGEQVSQNADSPLKYSFSVNMLQNGKGHTFT